MHRLALAGFGLLSLSMTACVPRAPAPAPAPPPVPAPPPPAPPPAPPSPPPADWRDAPLSPGDWSDGGGGTVAAFGAGARPDFAVRCDGAGRISLARAGAAGRSIVIRTTFGERSLPAAGQASETVATLAASDQLLDQIAFSRGRFLVQVDGAAPLILPAWPEPARVIEECRG